MDRSFFIRDRELMSSSNFLSRVDIITGGLEVDGYVPSDYGIRKWTSIRWYLF
jgi:hypothetical protein